MTRARSRRRTGAATALGALLAALLAGLPAAAPLKALLDDTPSPAPRALPRAGGAGAVPPADPGEDIRDIRGPKSVLPPWLVPAVLGGGAVLALGAYGLWRWLRRRRRARRPLALLPFELALKRLAELDPLMQVATAREFSIAVTDIVRSYIEQRFGVTATHRTTEEFLHGLLDSSNASLARHRGLLAEFLQQCDLAKFAGMALSTHSMDSLRSSARAFVLATAEPHGA